MISVKFYQKIKKPKFGLFRFLRFFLKTQVFSEPFSSRGLKGITKH